MEKIKLMVIVEMMGKPPEHLIQTLSSHVDKMKEEKGIKVIGKKISEPKKIENSDLFSTFAEVELEISDIEQLMMILFRYMPSHIEIIEPESIRINNFDLNTLCNEITRRLHDYDTIAKTIGYENQILQKKLIESQSMMLEKPENKVKKAVKKKRK